MKASGYARAKNDYYCEAPWSVDALLAVEYPFMGRVIDPCCGSGNIPIQLRAAGVDAAGSDLIDRGYGRGGVDFFTHGTPCDSIVSNPPYNRAQEFVETALGLTTDRVCVLLRLAFLEGQKRRSWHMDTPLARVWVSSRRMSMPPGGTDIPATGGTIAYAWLVYEHDHTGQPQLGWF